MRNECLICNVTLGTVLFFTVMDGLRVAFLVCVCYLYSTMVDWIY